MPGMTTKRPRQWGAGSGSGSSAPGWQGGGGARSGATRDDGNAASRDAGAREPGSPVTKPGEPSQARGSAGVPQVSSIHGRHVSDMASIAGASDTGHYAFSPLTPVSGLGPVRLDV